MKSFLGKKQPSVWRVTLPTLERWQLKQHALGPKETPHAASLAAQRGDQSDHRAAGARVDPQLAIGLYP